MSWGKMFEILSFASKYKNIYNLSYAFLYFYNSVGLRSSCTRLVLLTAWTKIRFSLNSTLQVPLTVYTDATKCGKTLRILFQKSTVFASRLTATILSKSLAISHSCRVLAHNKEIHWPVCYSAWLFGNFLG